jgi:hypothetical protein
MGEIVKCVSVHIRIAYPLLVFVAACSCAFAQIGTAALAPRIIINLPHNISPRVIWVRYALYGPVGSGGAISTGDTLEADSNFRHYISAVFGGAPARYAKVVVYAPGCNFATYDLDLASGSDVSEQFRCEPLGTKTVHGFINQKAIPSNTYLTDKKLDVVGYLDGMWVCSFLLQLPRTSQPHIEAGSCLGSDIPLGTVGEINPGRGGHFNMTIPDFTGDPVFDSFKRHGRFGVIELALKEKKIGRVLATIKTENGPELGINVQHDYRNPVIFTRIH